ncbi:SDR family oxidoreductase [Nonomuraea salmonea]|uniref:SDR family oxidoreductase n=1 Tax=Nonomuraea salmonea TaxID=46181 RepID=A0ABV5NHH3_9ACTN
MQPSDAVLALTLVLRPLPSPLVAVPALLTVSAMSLVWWPKHAPPCGDHGDHWCGRRDVHARLAGPSGHPRRPIDLRPHDRRAHAHHADRALVRRTAGSPGGRSGRISEALLGLQITQPPPSGLDAVALTLFWSIGTAGAVGPGAYLRTLDRHRVEAVTPPAFADLPAGFKERIAAQVPIGRLGEGAETATAALFLACADSSFVTGIGLPVDGGIGQV